MKHLLSIFAALFFIINIANAQTESYETRIVNGKQYIIYHVKTGDTWASIAEKLGVTERSLIDQNKQTNGTLKGVSTLKVSMDKSTKSTSSVIIKNTVKEAPVELNSLPKFGDDVNKKKPKVVKPKIYGQELRTEFKGANSLSVYRIGANDNINDLAKYYNCTADEIKTQNNLTSNELIPGKIIKIPVQTSSSESTENIAKTAETPAPVLTETPVTPIVIAETKEVEKTVVNPEVISETKQTPVSINNSNYITRVIKGKEYIIYPVAQNDTWKSIATKFGTTEFKLKVENSQTNNILSGAKTIKIPFENNNKIAPTNKVTEASVEQNKLPKFGDDIDNNKNTPIKPKLYGTQLKTEFRGEKILTVYRVGNGDNIVNLAKYFNTTVSDIVQQNNLTNNSLAKGKILKILGYAKPQIIPDSTQIIQNNLANNDPAKTESNMEKVMDNLTGTNNNTVDPSKPVLKANETLLGELIVVKKLSKLYIKHTVISGEDLTRISKENYTSNTKITNANGLKNSKLTTGQIILVPTNKQNLLKLTGLDFDKVEKENNEQKPQENQEIAENNSKMVTKNDAVNSMKNDTNARHNWGDKIYEAPNKLDSNATKTAKELSKEMALNEIHANANAGETKESFTHSVQVGESIEGIAKKYKISTSDISNWNDLYQNRIRVGQDLIVNLERARKPYITLNSVNPETNKQIKKLDKSERVKYFEEKGLCLFSDEEFIGVAHKTAPVGTLLLVTSTENFKKIYLRVTSTLQNTNSDIILQVDKVIAKQLAFNSNLTNVYLSYSLVE